MSVLQSGGPGNTCFSSQFWWHSCLVSVVKCPVSTKTRSKPEAAFQMDKSCPQKRIWLYSKALVVGIVILLLELVRTSMWHLCLPQIPMGLLGLRLSGRKIWMSLLQSPFLALRFTQNWQLYRLSDKWWCTHYLQHPHRLTKHQCPFLHDRCYSVSLG